MPDQTKQQLRLALKDEAMIALDSCHAAIQDGIAEEIAEILGKPVSGAMEASKLIDIEPLLAASGGLKLVATYLNRDTTRTILPSDFINSKLF